MGQPSLNAGVDVSEWKRFAEEVRWHRIAWILLPVVWLSLTLLYVGFWATGFTLVQSAIVLIVSVLLLGGFMGALWTAWDHSW